MEYMVSVWIIFTSYLQVTINVISAKVGCNNHVELNMKYKLNMIKSHVDIVIQACTNRSVENRWIAIKTNT